MEPASVTLGKLSLLERGDYPPLPDHSAKFSLGTLPPRHGGRLHTEAEMSGYVVFETCFDACFRTRAYQPFHEIWVRFAVVPPETLKLPIAEWGAGIPPIEDGVEVRRLRGSEFIFPRIGYRIARRDPIHVPLGCLLVVDVFNASGGLLSQVRVDVQYGFTRADFECGRRVRPCQHRLPTGAICMRPSSDAADAFEPSTFRCPEHGMRTAGEFRFGFRDYRGRFHVDQP